MRWTSSLVRLTVCCVATAIAATLGPLRAHEEPAPARGQDMAGMVHDAEGGNGADLGPALFAAADRNTDGAVTRAELKAMLETWFGEADTARAGSVGEGELLAALKLPQPRLALDSHVQAMLAALPDRPAAKP